MLRKGLDINADYGHAASNVFECFQRQRAVYQLLISIRYQTDISASSERRDTLHLLSSEIMHVGQRAELAPACDIRLDRTAKPKLPLWKTASDFPQQIEIQSTVDSALIQRNSIRSL